MQGDIYKLKSTGFFFRKNNINYSFNKNLKNEFEQMFYEAWAVLNENYYDVQFNKKNWAEIKKI